MYLYQVAYGGEGGGKRPPCRRAVAWPHGFSARLRRALLLAQGGVLELGRTLYACDEALENGSVALGEASGRARPPHTQK